MPLISMYERDNSRVAYRILANRALEMLTTQPASVDDVGRIPLNNLARLLEHYRYNDFSDHEPAGVLEAVASRQLRGISSEPAAGEKPRFEDLRTSLDRAKHAAFGEQPKDDVVQCLQAVLSSLANGSLPGNVSENAIQHARQFFSTLAQGLGAESEDG